MLVAFRVERAGQALLKMCLRSLLYRGLKLPNASFELLRGLLDIVRYLDHTVDGECDMIGTIAQEEAG